MTVTASEQEPPTSLCVEMRLFHRANLEPDGVHRRQEDQRHDGPSQRAANQGVRQGAPEHRMGQWDKRQNRRHGGKQHRPRALHGRFNHGVKRVKTLLLVMVDLSDQDQGGAHQDTGQGDQPYQRIDAERRVEQEQGRHDPDAAR